MRDLSYGWNNGAMMMTALKSINDESLRLMEIISYEDKLPDWTLAKVSTALDRLTMARQHIQSMIELGYTPNPGIMDKIKSVLGFSKKAAASAAQYTSDRYVDARQSMSISAIQKKLDNLRACAQALEISDAEMKETKSYKDLVFELAGAQRQRSYTMEQRRMRKSNPTYEIDYSHQGVQNYQEIEADTGEEAYINWLMGHTTYFRDSPSLIDVEQIDLSNVKVRPKGMRKTLQLQEEIQRKKDSEYTYGLKGESKKTAILRRFQGKDLYRYLWHVLDQDTEAANVFFQNIQKSKYPDGNNYRVIPSLRDIPVPKRKKRKNPDHTRKDGILRPRGEGFNEARQALREEYREKYGSDWHKDKSLKDEMYDRLRAMGY